MDLYEKYHDQGLAILSVSVSWDKDSDARRFAETYRLPFLVGRDPSGSIGAPYRVEATPTTVFIDRRGILVERKEGELGKDEFEQRIQKLLAS